MERSFRLAGLLRLRRLEEERSAAKLAAANGAIHEAEEQRDDLTSAMAGTIFPRHVDEDTWRCAVAARASLTALVGEATVAVDVAVRRGELAAADWTAARARVSMLDKLADRHDVLVRAEDDKAEQLLLDEAASRRKDQEER
jgi:flagellar FliJ protein